MPHFDKMTTSKRELTQRVNGLGTSGAHQHETWPSNRWVGSRLARSCVSWPIGRAMRRRREQWRRIQLFLRPFSAHVRTLRNWLPQKMYAVMGRSVRRPRRKLVTKRAHAIQKLPTIVCFNVIQGLPFLSPNETLTLKNSDWNIFRKEAANIKSINQARTEVTSRLM